MPNLAKKKKIQISVKLNAELVERVDQLASDLGLNRTGALSIALLGGLNYLEVVTNPGAVLNDPALAGELTALVKKVAQNAQED